MPDLEHARSGYIPTTPTERATMFEAVRVTTINQLFLDIPQSIIDPHLELPQPLTEMELMAEMKRMASKNRTLPSFLGYGSYNRFQPAAVRAIVGRDEFLTSYTPYQPEVSQGTLQTAFEYQTMMCNLYGMEVSNTGMYDGPTALAEAALMAVRVKGDPNRRKVVALDTVHPNWLEVTKTYLSGKGLELDVVGLEDIEERSKDASAVIAQSPNFLGNIEDLKDLGNLAHSSDALFIVAADPVSLGLLKSPGEYEADIAVGEGQSLGHYPNLGGVNLGIFTAKQKYVRQMPGRIVGETTDNKDRTAYVLTLQPREQHIRRAGATSNICTAEQLVALGSTIYLASLGPRGFRQVAEMNYHNAHYLANEITKIPGYRLAFPNRHFFNEFVVQGPTSPTDINSYLLGEGVIGGKDVSDRVEDGMLLCTTETTTKSQMDKLVGLLAV